MKDKLGIVMLGLTCVLLGVIVWGVVSQNGWYLFGGLLGLILQFTLASFFKGGNKRYTIHLASNDVMHVYRNWYDFWLFDASGMMAFHLAEDFYSKTTGELLGKQGEIVKASKHFTLLIIGEKEEKDESKE